MILSVVSPDRSIVSKTAVEAIVLPAEGGQLTLLPGHINFITTLTHGTFGYKVNSEWQVAFLSKGFSQVYNGEVTVLAETMELAGEIDLAASELKLQQLLNKIKSTSAASEEYLVLVHQKDLAEAAIKAAKKNLH